MTVGLSAAPRTAPLGAVPRRRVRRRRPPWVSAAVWIAPAALVMLFVFGWSVVQLLTKSFRYNGAWTGLDNFRLVVTDPLFQTALRHNLLLLLVVPVLVAVAFLVAVLLFETRRGHALYRWAVFLPYILPIPVVGVVFGQLLQLNGALNTLLRSLGLGAVAQDWLGNPHLALWTMGGVILWKEVGFGILLLLARMFALDAEVYEAARMDGARFWRLHWSITLPQITGIVVFYAITEAITMVSWVFNYVYVMTNGQGGPGDATVVTELYIYRTAFANHAPELAAAAAVLLFAATLLLVVAFFRMQRRSMHSTFGS